MGVFIITQLQWDTTIVPLQFVVVDAVVCNVDTPYVNFFMGESVGIVEAEITVVVWICCSVSPVFSVRKTEDLYEWEDCQSLQSIVTIVAIEHHAIAVCDRDACCS